MFRVPCRRHENIGGFIVGTNNFLIDAIKGHDNSECHITNNRNYEITHKLSDSSATAIFTSHTGDITASTSSGSEVQDGQPILVGPMDVAIRRINEEQKTKLTACFNTAYFIAKEEMPFTMYPNILDLQE